MEIWYSDMDSCLVDYRKLSMKAPSIGNILGKDLFVIFFQPKGIKI